MIRVVVATIFLLYIALAFLYAPPALLRRAFLLKKFKHSPITTPPTSGKENKIYYGIHPLQTLGMVGAWIFLISLLILLPSLGSSLIPLATISGIGLAISPLMIIVGNFPYVWLNSYAKIESAAIKAGVAKVKRQRILMIVVWVVGIALAISVPLFVIYARAN